MATLAKKVPGDLNLVVETLSAPKVDPTNPIVSLEKEVLAARLLLSERYKGDQFWRTEAVKHVLERVFPGEGRLTDAADLYVAAFLGKEGALPSDQGRDISLKFELIISRALLERKDERASRYSELLVRSCIDHSELVERFARITSTFLDYHISLLKKEQRASDYLVEATIEPFKSILVSALGEVTTSIVLKEGEVPLKAEEYICQLLARSSGSTLIVEARALEIERIIGERKFQSLAVRCIRGLGHLLNEYEEENSYDPFCHPLLSKLYTLGYLYNGCIKPDLERIFYQRTCNALRAAAFTTDCTEDALGAAHLRSIVIPPLQLWYGYKTTKIDSTYDEIKNALRDFVANKRGIIWRNYHLLLEVIRLGSVVGEEQLSTTLLQTALGEEGLEPSWLPTEGHDGVQKLAVRHDWPKNPQLLAPRIAVLAIWSSGEEPNTELEEALHRHGIEYSECDSLAEIPFSAHCNGQDAIDSIDKNYRDELYDHCIEAFSQGNALVEEEKDDLPIATVLLATQNFPKGMNYWRRKGGQIVANALQMLLLKHDELSEQYPWIPAELWSKLSSHFIETLSAGSIGREQLAIGNIEVRYKHLKAQRKFAALWGDKPTFLDLSMQLDQICSALSKLVAKLPESRARDLKLRQLFLEGVEFAEILYGPKFGLENSSLLAHHRLSQLRNQGLALLALEAETEDVRVALTVVRTLLIIHTENEREKALLSAEMSQITTDSQPELRAHLMWITYLARYCYRTEASSQAWRSCEVALNLLERILDPERDLAAIRCELDAIQTSLSSRASANYSKSL